MVNKLVRLVYCALMLDKKKVGNTVFKQVTLASMWYRMDGFLKKFAMVW